MPSRPRLVRYCALALALAAAGAIGFAVSGSLLYDAAIGLDRSAFPFGGAATELGKLILPSFGMSLAGLVLALGVLLVLGAAGFLVGRRVAKGAGGGAPDRGRRGIVAGFATALGATAMGGLGMWLRAFRGVGNEGRGWSPVVDQIFSQPVAKTDPDPKQAWKESRIRAHRRLGRTGWEVSDIVLGTGAISGEVGEQVARDALARGVNYFDTAPDYSGAGSEQAMGRALRSVGRDRIFVATKFCTPEGHLPAGAPVSRYEEVIEESLRRLGTDYVDLVHIHSCDEIPRLMDPNAHEAFDRLKQAGKVRFLGFSSHTPNLVSVTQQAIASGRFDVMMLAYHHGIWPEIPELVRRARSEQDMGVVAMKTLKGAKHRGLADFRDEADSYAQAALKWVLSNPDVSCAVISFTVPQHVDEYLHASGQAITASDLAILAEYDRRIAGTHCAPHCGKCLDRCPEALPIPDVLRHRMYFEDYGREKEAMRLYAKLERNAAVCASCSAPCLGSCPVGIEIPTRMRGAHDLLHFV